MINIKNTQTVKSEAQGLITESQKMQSVNESIKTIMQELNQYWSDVQEDQQKFYKGLSDDVTVLQTIYTCEKEFANSMLDYMEVTESTSKKTV